ncbi:MAG: polysaccharide deacetylase family protein [Firmicutes bacterium]|nr:polysaccharide deacetylase family protein [Bacillota bacterium]
MRAGRSFSFLLLVLLLLSLTTATVGAGPPLLKLGDRGEAVKELQRDLLALGHSPGVVDGIFGPKTMAAVKGFQASLKLAADGIAGPGTAAALAKALQEKKAAVPASGTGVGNKSSGGPAGIGEQVHLVKPGDTLYRISKSYGVSLDALVQKNRLEDPSKIKIGQRLIIPTASSKPVISENQEIIVYPGQGSSPPSGKAWGKVALTFDDGPDPVYGPKIAEVLKRYQARATFFVIGKEAEKYPDLIRNLAVDGCEIGNHTYSHPDLADMDKQAVGQEVKKTADLLERLAGKRPVVFRPPYGFVSADLQEVVRGEGEKIILWSNLGSWDFPDRQPEELANQVGDFAFDGAIIMLHETMKTTAEALPTLLERLKRKGLEPVTVSQLLAR